MFTAIAQLIRDVFFWILHSILRVVDPRRWKGGGARRFRLSSAMVTALLMFFFLALVLTAWWIYVHNDEGSARAEFYQYLPYSISLVLVIPIVSYLVVRVFQLEDLTFADINAAWEAGLDELARNRIDIRHTPLFLVLGTQDELAAQRLMRSAERDFAVENVPAGTAPLHWYANQDAIFLVLSQVGCVTQLTQNAKQSLKSLEIKRPASAAGQNQGELGLTFWPTEEPVEEAEESLEASSEPLPSLGGAGPANLAGTMFADEFTPQATATKPEPSQQQSVSVGLTNDQKALQTDRIEYVCRLLSRDRRGGGKEIAPVNGVLVTLPLNAILCDETEGAAIKQAARQDLRAILHFAQLRSPAFAVVTHWEDDAGFRELIHRLGGDRIRGRRFGKGGEVWAPPAPARVGGVCELACWAFEDWIYHLFRQGDALERGSKGNRALYNLLCKVRRYLKPRLQKVLTEGFAAGDKEDPKEAPLFGGCYFLSAAQKEDQRAFAAPVFDAVINRHRELEWTDRAMAKEGRLNTWANGLYLAAFSMLIAVLAIHFWP